MRTSLAKRLLILAGCIAIFGLIAACSGDDNTTLPTTTATPKATGAAAGTSAAQTTVAATTKTATATAQATVTPAATVKPATGAGGTWGGEYTSTSNPGSNGTFIIEWTQSGSQLSGTISVTNTPGVTEGTITGSIEGSTITFGAVEGTSRIDYEGSINGDTMSGTYSSPSCGNAKGTWQAARA